MAAAKKKRGRNYQPSKTKKQKKHGKTLVPGPYIYYGILAVFLLLFAFIRLNHLDFPFERDEGDYCLTGQLTLEGETPYIDFYEQKPPGIFYSYAAVVGLAGKSLSSIHFAFIIINLITSLLLFFCGRALFDAKAGLVAAVSFAVLSINPSVSGFTVQSEHLLSLFMAGGLLAGIRGLQNNKFYLLIIAGALLAWSMLIKQNGVFFTGFMGIMVILYHLFAKAPRKKLLFDTLWYALGVIGVLALISIIMLLQGSFDEMLFWIYQFPKESYVNAIPLEKGIEYFQFWLRKVTVYYWPFWLLGTLGLITIWFIPVSRFVKWFVCLFFLFGFLSIIPGYRFYPHYWIHFLPSVAIAGGALVFSLSWWLTQKGNVRAGEWIITGLFVLLVILNVTTLSTYYFNPSVNNVIRSTYGSNPFIETKKLSDYIERKARPEDKMVVVGSEPQMHFYTQVMSPSRHTFMAFLISSHPRQNVWRNELKQDVQSAEPRFLVMVLHPMSWAMPPDADQSIIQWFMNYANSFYRPVAHVNLDQPGQPIYYWDQEAVNPAQKGSKYITVYERR